MGSRPGRPEGQRQEVSVPAVSAPAEHGDAFATGGVYGVLLLLGGVEAMIGSFEYSWMAGPVPAAALGCCAAILLTCLLAGWAMQSLAGAIVPALGWIIVSFVLAMPDAQGSVIITNTPPGKWYLYGGAVSAAIGVAAAFAIWIRSQSGTKPAR
ncbi:MAG TPA: hypothetical protein VE733_17435 [Streptosporangiaceae bacterium]|nr:hypothetical protein [Streptosporangiaceae bacterium]